MRVPHAAQAVVELPGVCAVRQRCQALVAVEGGGRAAIGRHGENLAEAGLYHNFQTSL